MKNKQRRIVRLIAILLAVLLAGSALVSAIYSFAYAEEAPARSECTLTMEYLENEQALRVSQRLVYRNESDLSLDRLLFYAPANLFRRESSAVYAADDADAAFVYGYLPGGIELLDVRVNGEAADYGFQGESEIYLRVACELSPGESCEFSFEYYLLLTQNRAFLGVDSSDCRLSGFYFSPAYADDSYGEFILSSPVSFTRWVHSPAMDFSATITLPSHIALAATGEESAEELENGLTRWSISAANCRDFALAFGNDHPETVSGTLRCFTSRKSAAKKLLAYAEEAVEVCERWFGPLPCGGMDFMETGDCNSFRSHSGMAWFSEELLKEGGEDLRRAVYFCIAQQYFGFSAYAQPSADAWLSDSVCEYLSYLILEEVEGNARYLEALNENIVPSLQLTIPGGLTVVSDASLFSAYEYSVVVLDRGAAVFHELRTAMGRDALIDGLANFYRRGQSEDVLTEMMLVEALDATGGSWEAFLTDWVFNIGEYVNQEIDWLD